MRILLALLMTLAVLPAAPALDPMTARGVFWKQQKQEKGSEENVSEAPGTWGYDRTSIFNQLKNAGINVIVIDIDTDIRLSAGAKKRAEIRQFLKDLYAWDYAMPIRVWLHQRRYFREAHAGASEFTAKIIEAAEDIKSVFAELSPEESTLIDGIRWGENGDEKMEHHLINALLYAHALNKTQIAGTTQWLRNHTYIINGCRMGCEFKGLLAAEKSIDFSKKIASQVGAFGWAYKHFTDKREGAGGIRAVFANYSKSFHPTKPDNLQSWQDLYKDEFGLNELQAWYNSRPAEFSHLKNYIYVGDSADSVSTTPEHSLDALKSFFSPKIRPVFMIPIAAQSEKTKKRGYYRDNKILWWVSGPPETPDYSNSRAYAEWAEGWN